MVPFPFLLLRGICDERSGHLAPSVTRSLGNKVPYS